MLRSSSRYLHEVLQARKCLIFVLSMVSSDSSSESREMLFDLIDVTVKRAHEKQNATPLYFHRKIYFFYRISLSMGVAWSDSSAPDLEWLIIVNRENGSPLLTMDKCIKGQPKHNSRSFEAKTPCYQDPKTKRNSCRITRTHERW